MRNRCRWGISKPKARRAAAALSAVVAMKGAETYVVAENGLFFFF